MINPKMSERKTVTRDTSNNFGSNFRKHSEMSRIMTSGKNGAQDN